MHFTKLFTFAAVVTTGVLAAPPLQPQKPSPRPAPTIVSIPQKNVCGNGATPFCCNTDITGAYTVCSALAGGSTCSATTVCCNAVNSVQLCLGNAVIINAPVPPPSA